MGRLLSHLLGSYVTHVLHTARIRYDERVLYNDTGTLMVRLLSHLIAELLRAKRACEAPWVSKSTHPRKFGNHVTVHRPQPARPSAPQENQCSISHFLASLVAQED